VSVDVKRKGHSGLETVGDAHGVAGIANAFEQDGKFVSAKTAKKNVEKRVWLGDAQGIVRAQTGIETASDLDERALGDCGAEVGIEILEVVNIDEEGGIAKGRITAGLRKAALQAFEKGATIGKSGERVVNGVVGEPFFSGFFGGDVTIHDHQLLDLSFGVANGAGGGVEGEPRAVLVAQAILETLADARFARLAGGFADFGAIFGMNLLEDRSASEFGGGVSKNLGVGGALIKAAPFDVNERDHVSGVLGDDLEELFTVSGAAGGEEYPDLLHGEEEGEREEDGPSGSEEDGEMRRRDEGEGKHAKIPWRMNGSRNPCCMPFDGTPARWIGKSGENLREV
jgi:hypothetical protein